MTAADTDVQVVNAFEVKIAGAALAATAAGALKRIEVVQRLNAPSSTILTFHDTSTESDSVMDTPALAVGKAMEVSAKAGEGGSSEPIFKGEITAIEFELEAGTSYVTVKAHDKLQRLYHGTCAEAKMNVSYSDLIRAMASAAGLDAAIDSTSEVFKHAPQSWLSNGDFLGRLAAEIGYVFYSWDGKLHFEKPSWTAATDVTVTHGTDLLRFRASQTAEPAATKVTVRGWDVAKKEAIVGTATEVKANGVKLTKDPAASYSSYVNGDVEVAIGAAVVPSQSHATAVAKATADRIGDAASTADGLCRGNPKIIPGKTIKVDKVPAAVAGDYYITEARHVFDGEYQVEFRCSGALDTGLWSSAVPGASPVPQVPAPNPAGLVALPAIVTNNKYEDADGNLGPREVPAVKVKFPTLSDNKESDWYRLVQLGAGAERGMLFMPEVNDEVLVVFAHGDMRAGYVLGGLYNGSDKPGKDLVGAADVVASGGVERRGMVSRTGHQVIFDDKGGAEQIRIVDKTGTQKLIWDATEKKLMVDSNDQQLLIYGQGDGTIIESKGDLTIKSAGKLNLESQQDMMAKSSMKATVEAVQDLALAGMNIEAKATASAAVKGATTELNGTGQTTVKGGMVMIN